MELKIKIVAGFRPDQHYTIGADELHKAYYLFENPTERGIFNNGVAIRGQDIQTIEPDYQGTMEWNSTHKLDDDDMNEIRNKGIDRRMRTALIAGKEVARIANAEDLNVPLYKLVKEKYQYLLPESKKTNQLNEG